MEQKYIKFILFTALLFALAVPVSAQKGNIRLLAVSETTGGIKGSIAHLDLDIEPGEGRVFIDTLPATKVDTQLSTRFAKDMACRYLNVDCSNLDFFYQIRADSPIVGGPSAGAAITILTISLLDNVKLDPDMAITGTINSGELIGNVGGIKEKIEAASEEGVKTVLIPKGEGVIEIDNVTIDMIEYGKELGVLVIEVSSIDDVIFHYTGQHEKMPEKDVEISQTYKDTMKFLADGLCSRSISLKEETENFRVSNISLIDERFSEQKKSADNLTLSGQESFEDEKFYSAASYCFGANVKYKSLILLMENLTPEEINATLIQLEENISETRKKIDEFKIKTMTDLQAYMVINDRLEESEQYLNSSREFMNDTSRIPDALSIAIERYNSAISWSHFLGQKGAKFKISDAELRRSCINRISEVEEHYSYVDYLFSGLLSNIKDDIELARQYYEAGDYAKCLHKATLIKAQIGVVSSSIGVKQDAIEDLLDRKLEAAKKSIIRQQEQGIFPILGYSYYEYATSLKGRDTYSALLHAENSIELSNLDIYFEPDKIRISSIESNDLIIFFAGMAIGVMLSALIIIIDRWNRNRPSRPRAPKHRKIKFRFNKKS